MPQTQIFPDFYSWLHRADPRINGVDPQTALNNQHVLRDEPDAALANTACWNCVDCEGCIACVDCLDCKDSVACVGCTRLNASSFLSDCNNCARCVNLRAIDGAVGRLTQNE